MNRRIFLMSAAGAAGCGRDAGSRLNVFNWSGYIAPGTVPGFERDSGIRVRYAVYESNEEMLARVLSGNSGWDVVFPSHYYIEPMRALGLLAPLRRQWLPHADSLDGLFRSPAWDRGLQWCIPYLWGGTGIVYSRKLTPAPEAWRSMWEARLAARITMLDDPAEVLGAALKKLGLPLNCWGRAELLAAQAWSSTSQQAMDASGDLAFAFPSEGFPLYADCAVVLRESRRVEQAHRFLDYLLRPEVAWANSRAARSASCARPAWETPPNPVLYPPPEVLARGEWWQTPPVSVQRLRDRLWTEIKSA